MFVVLLFGEGRSLSVGGTGAILSPFPVGAGIPDGSRVGELTAETRRMEGCPSILHPRPHPPCLSARGAFAPVALQVIELDQELAVSNAFRREGRSPQQGW